MSTILKALKKAEEGMARNTLPGKILASDSARAFEDARSHNRTRTVLLISLLAAVAGVVYYMYYMKPHVRRADVTATDSRQPALSVPTAAPVKKEIKQENVAPPPLNLSGILWDDTNPIAILNGKPLAVGGEVDGTRVTKIGPNGVEIRYNGRDYTLTVE